MRKVYDLSTLGLITFFESMTGARVKDCIPDLAMFIVEKGDMGLAMGRNMRNLKSVESALRKHVKVLEFDENVEKFVSNIIHPLVAEAKLEGKNLIIKGGDRETRARSPWYFADARSIRRFCRGCPGRGASTTSTPRSCPWRLSSLICRSLT